MKTRRFAAALLAAAMVFGLAGCGKDEQKDAEKLGFRTSLYYTLEDVSETAGLLVGCCTDRESIWYLSEPAEDAAQVLRRVSLDGTEAAVLSEYQSPEDANGSWGPVLGGDGKLWVWERCPDPQDARVRTYRVRQLDPDTGKELSVVDITEAMSGMDRNSTSGFAVDAFGTIWLADKLRIIAVDGQGQVLDTLRTRLPEALPSDGAGGLLALLPDGKIGALVVQEGDGRKVRAIDPEARDWAGVEYYVRNNVNSIYSGSGECAFYYISQECVYGAVAGDEVPVRFLPWSNAYLDHPGAVRCFVLLESGEAVIFSDIHEAGMSDWDDKLQVTRLLPSDTEPEGAPVNVVYGTIGVDWLIQERINSFNREDNGCRIIVRDYSEGMMYHGEKNSQVYSSALARLYADMSTGQGPDILDSSIPLEGLSRQDALEDLWPWIDNDPELEREDLMEHLLECMEADGKLTSVCSGFAIETAVASAAVAGDRTGWTMEEMLDAFGGEMPEFYFSCLGGFSNHSVLDPHFTRIDKRSTLYYMVNMSLDRFIDWDTGECSFNGEDFKSVLRLVDSMEDAVSGGADLSNPYVRMDMGLTFSNVGGVEAAETVRVLPWEGGPLLYMRTLEEPKDLVADDVLFGGRDSLTGYEQRLWDAGLLEWGIATIWGKEVPASRLIYGYPQYDWWINGCTDVFPMVKLGHELRGTLAVAADCAVGGADGEVYAAYPGVPAASGSGSSFNLLECMGISAASTRKEEAWGFVRRLLLPGGNTTNIAEDPAGHVRGFSINRATFEEQMAQRYWTDPYSGDLFPDAEGNPVEYTPCGLCVGYPDDVVLAAFLFQPTQAQMERFWRLYEATDHITGREDDLLDIILEQADAYFAGDKSLEETAGLIQNRAKLYVNERR